MLRLGESPTLQSGKCRWHSVLIILRIFSPERAYYPCKGQHPLQILHVEQQP
jgi:hypothetical protein